MKLIDYWRQRWQQQSPKKREVLSSGFVIALALIIASLVTLFGFQSYRVDGPSMESNLRNGDRLIIDKVPRTLARISGHAYIPHRGDIVVFNQMGIGAPNNNKQLIKRVIGLPGEKVTVSDGKVTVYNKAYPNGFNPDLQGWWQLQNSQTDGQLSIILSANEIFVLGDNRPDSTDSRVFGAVKANQIIGKLVLRLIPLNRAQFY